jgi:hypothetical protein
MIDEDDCGAIGGMKIGKGSRSTRRKPAPAPLCPPQNLLIAFVKMPKFNVDHPFRFLSK